jgi:hypothetical protein
MRPYASAAGASPCRGTGVAPSAWAGRAAQCSRLEARSSPSPASAPCEEHSGEKAPARNDRGPEPRTRSPGVPQADASANLAAPGSAHHATRERPGYTERVVRPHPPGRQGDPTQWSRRISETAARGGGAKHTGPHRRVERAVARRPGLAAEVGASGAFSWRAHPARPGGRFPLKGPVPQARPPGPDSRRSGVAAAPRGGGRSWPLGVLVGRPGGRPLQKTDGGAPCRSGVAAELLLGR